MPHWSSGLDSRPNPLANVTPSSTDYHPTLSCITPAQYMIKQSDSVDKNIMGNNRKADPWTIFSPYHSTAYITVTSRLNNIVLNRYNIMHCKDLIHFITLKINVVDQ